MNKRLPLLAASLLVSAVALAGDPAAGKEKAQPCTACHGPDGNSAAPSFPKLAGQNEKYMIKQLQDIQSGARPVPQMTGQLDGMDDGDFADIAAWYASQEMTTGQAEPDLVEKGEKIYRAGIADREIPACTGCHSPTGQGNAAAGYPVLAGQHAQYTAAQLRAFRAAADGDPSGRHNDGEEKQTMRSIAFALSESEIEAVSSYIEGLFSEGPY